ncbi:MAG: hypothetical protein WBQ24_22935, partial [Xanthobacteraceae bacterium]
VPDGTGTDNLMPLGLAGQAAHLTLAAPGTKAGQSAPPTSVALYDQGLAQVLEAAVTGLEPKQPYLLALSEHPDGSGKLQGLSGFMTNPAGGAIVNAVGPVRQLVRGEDTSQRRYLVIAPGTADEHGAPVQIQVQ